MNWMDMAEMRKRNKKQERRNKTKKKREGKRKNSHILPTGQWYAPSAVNYSAYSAYFAYPAYFA